MATTASALDIDKPVAIETENGVFIHYQPRLPNKWPRTIHGTGNYRKHSVEFLVAAGWVNVEPVMVYTTNVIDRTAYTVAVTNEVDGEVYGPEPVDPLYWKEVEFIGHVHQAGLKIKPDATLDEVIGEARKDFAGRKAKLAIERDASGRGNSSRQAEINEGVEESMELRLEAFMLGYDLFDPDFAQPTKTVIERKTVIKKKD